MNSDLRAKLAKLKLTDADIAEAVQWARKSRAVPQPGSVQRQTVEAAKTKRSRPVK